MDKLPIDTLVKYTGEYERCHGSVYKIIKNFDNAWFDLELVTPRDEFAYKTIWSVPDDEIEIEI